MKFSTCFRCLHVKAVLKIDKYFNRSNRRGRKFSSLDLCMESNFFFFIFQEISENIKKILAGAEKLLQSGHYEADLIESIAGSLEQEWKQFAMDISERGNLLACSVGFHRKSEEVL